MCKILKSPREKRRKEKVKPKNPDKKENIKLIKYQNFLFTLGRINLFEIVIKRKANKEIKIAVPVLKTIVEIFCKSSLKK